MIRLIDGALKTYSDVVFHGKVKYTELTTLMNKKPKLVQRKVVGFLHTNPISLSAILNILHIIREDCVYVPLFVINNAVENYLSLVCEELVIIIEENLQSSSDQISKKSKIVPDSISCLQCLYEQKLHCDCCSFWLSLGKDLEQCRVQCCIVDSEIFKLPETIFNKFNENQVITLRIFPAKRCSHFENVSSVYDLPSDIVYTLTTSGTTGIPKVVSVPDSSILPNILYFQKVMNIKSSDKVLFCAPLTFDPSIVEIFMTICAGASFDFLKINKGSNMANPNELCRQISQVTVLMCTPSLISIIPEPLRNRTLFQSKLRLLAIGGEMFPSGLAEEYFSARIKKSYNMDFRIFNIYGITEQSCWSFIHEFGEQDFQSDYKLGSTPLGLLVPGTKYHIEDGQLYLGGDRRCYINGERCLDWYATGDNVTMANDMLYIIGRCNVDQIKINGKRICRQLARNAIKRHFHTESHVKFEKDGRLNLFIFTNADFPEVNIRKDLSKILPDHYKFDKIILYPNGPPLTNHQKINENALSSVNLSLELNESNLNNCVLDFLVVRGYETKELTDQILLNVGLDSMDILQLANFLIDTMPGINNLIELNALFQTLVYSPVNKIWNSLSDLWSPDSHNPLSCPNSEHIYVLSKANLFLCVDSSPAIFKKNSVMCYCIGSHAGILFCGTLPQSKELWRLQLPDRIESSPCFSDSFLYVGCYDGAIYIVESEKGELVQSVKTGNQVKCSPVATTFGEVFCGSHDGRIYRITKKHSDAGTGAFPFLFESKSAQICVKPIVASPLIFKTSIIVCCLSGNITVLNHTDLKTILSKKLESPIFSSPICSHDKEYLYVALVSGYLLEISTADLSITQKVLVEGLLYSDLVLYRKNQLLVASHNKQLHSFQIPFAVQSPCRWSTNLNSETSSTPLIINEMFILLPTANGALMVLDSQDGTCKAQIELPGQIFSSPKMCRNDSKIYFVVGCRDNYCYVFEFKP